jgi:hypothetical protein
MLEKLIKTDNPRPRGALEIEQRIRQREELRRLLEAEYGAQPASTRKPMRKGLATLLASLFSLSI